MKYLLTLLLACACFGQTLPNAVPMPTPEVQYLDSSGVPLAGGKLCTYQAGTAIPLATYTDSTANTPNANPIVLDSAGRASVWVGPALYKFVLRSGGDGTCNTGSVIWTQDNVADTALYFVNFVKTAGTATLISYTAPFSGAVQRTVASKLADYTSVKDCGATGDGATDDTAAIQACLDALPASGGTVYFPEGTYLTTSTLTIPEYGRILGAGWNWAGSTGQSMLLSNLNINMVTGASSAGPFSVNHSRSISIENLTIKGAGGAGSRGIYDTDAIDGWFIQNVYVTNFGEECIKLGNDITTFGGSATYLNHILTTNCVLVNRNTRTDYIGAVDVGIFDLYMNAVEAQATVAQATGNIGSGFVAAMVSRETGNGWYTNNVCELSQVGCVFLGIGPGYVAGNRADLNQGAGFKFIGHGSGSSYVGQLTVSGNWAYRNSQDSDGAYPGFYTDAGEMSFINNRCLQQPPTDDALPKMGNCFEDVSTTVSTDPRLGNVYIGNRSEGIVGHTYSFSGTVATQVYSDPEQYLKAGLGGIPAINDQGSLVASPTALLTRTTAGISYLGVDSDAIVITAATQASPTVLTLASAAPANWIVGSTIMITGATYVNGSSLPSSETQCWTLNQPQTVLAVSGTSVSIDLDGTRCDYLASSARAFLAPVDSITVNVPGSNGAGRTASAMMSGRLARYRLQDKRAGAFGSNNSKWQFATNFDGAGGTYNQLIMDAVSDDDASFGRFITFNRAVAAITPVSVSLVPSAGFVNIGSDAGDTAAGRGKLQIYGGSIQMNGLAFASLGTAGFQVVYCTNCNIASPCTSGGAGAWAFRSAGNVWKCPF